MDILKRPGSLSLAGNIDRIVVSSSYELLFVLRNSSGAAIVENSYSPNGQKRVEIDVKSIIVPLLTFSLKNVAEPYRQMNIAQTFTAEISEVVNALPQNTQTVSFTALRAGVDELSDAVENFLEQNFLTWQPNMKPVTYYSPEFLTYYAVTAATMKCRATMEDGSTRDLTMATIPAGECWTVPLQYAIVAGKLSALPAYYDVWMENTSGQRMTYVQRYYADDMRSQVEEWVLFENSLGGIDTFRAYGDSDNTAEHTHNVVEIDEEQKEYRVDTERNHTKNTGHLDTKERTWLLDFFPSLGKYIYTDQHIRQIVVTESDVNYKAKTLPSSYTFTYRYATTQPYLNLPRTDTPQEVMELKVPEVGSFTIAPRLVEFPRQVLSRGALFPIQDPYSEGWGTTTMTAMQRWIVQMIEEDYDGNGGIGHRHDNISLLDALALVKDYLTVNGEKINAGYADEARTFKDNEAPELITFLQGLVSKGKITARQGVDFGTFIAGLYGSGGNIDSMGRAELHSLFVRTSISAPKFVFNLVNVTKAEQWNTNGYGSIKSVDKDNRICELQLEDNEYGSLEVGDICRGIYADIDNAFGSDSNVEGAIDDCGFTVHQGFFTTYFYVEKVLESRKGVFKFRYGKRSETTPDPCAFMDFAQYGNFTNEERRASTYFSSRGKSYIEELGDVKTWEIQSENRVVRLGWLGNLQVKRKDGTWLQLKGNGLFVQNNIYFGGQANFIDGLSELEDLKEMAAAYDVSLSQYQSVLTVDDMGNVINGLYTEDEAKTTKQYRISTAVFVRKGTQILLEEDPKNEDVTEGHYRLHVVSEDCDVEVRNSTVYVTGIRNVKDGVGGTEDDATFDYEAMRRMSDAMVLIVVDLEGKTSKTIQMPIRIQHDSLPFMVCDITNENASVAWNSKAKKYVGLPVKSTVNLMYRNEPWLISECKIVGGVPDGLAASLALNSNGKSYDLTIDGSPAEDILPQVSNIVITVVGRYAGANYEYTKTLTLSKSADNVIYEIVPSADSIVVDKIDNMTANLLTCEIYATSSDDKRYKLTTLPDGFTLKYGKNTDTPDTVTSMDSAVVVNADDKQVTFALYDKSGNVLDKESVPVLAYGKDGKGIEYVFRRTTGSTPGISTPDYWATNSDYQQEDYVPSGWTDDPVGVTEYYLYEWVATRKSVNGVWQPFGEVSEYAHFGKHAPRAIVSDDIVTIPTDSSGTTLTSFSETINFSMLVNASAATVNYISRTSSLPSGVSCTVYTRSIVISVAEGTSLGTVSKTLNFDVSGTLNSASYQDSVSIKIVPNVTGKDGDGYEYVYYLASQEMPSLAAPTRSGGTLTSGWQDDVPSMTDTARYIYVAWKTGETGSDGSFSSPKLFSYKAKDGVGEATAYCRTAINPTISPSVTSRDTFVNADASASLGASLYGSDPAIGNTIITSGWDSIKSAATLHSYWRKNIPDVMEVTNVRANIDNFAKLSSKDSSGNMSYSDCETGYWENATLNGYGWWKSPDHEVGKDNSVTHVMKIEFTTAQAMQVVTFVIRTSSEANYNYGILGRLDTELSFTLGGIGNYTVKVSGTNEVFVPILVSSAGNHHIWVAYSKDDSSKSGDDRCYVRIAADELHQIKGIVDGETIQWETISEVKATKGEKGYGCVMRISLWSKGKQYVNESNMEGDGTKYIDCVYVEDTTANEGYRLYECRVSHSSDEHTYEETNYWRQLSDQGPIYTPLIVAKNAVFKFAQGQQFNITDDSGVVWGSFRHVTNDNDLALWLGATSGTDGSNASFSVTKGGKMTATNAKISGEIEATSGKIGGFIIEETSIRSRKDAYTGGSGINSFGSSEFFLHSNGSNNAFCGFSATNKWSGIGLNTLPATAGFTALARFSDTTQDSDSWSLDSWTKIGVYLDISGAKTYDDVGKGNCAIYAKHGVYAGFRIGTRLTTKSLTLTDMDNLIVCYNTTEITITLPSGCEKGQVFFIRPAGTGIVTVAAETGKILRNGDNMGGGVSSDTLGGKWMHTFIYDKYNNVWLMSFSN